MIKCLSLASTFLQNVMTPPVTLEKLASCGMFASVPLQIPLNVQTSNIIVHYNGELTTYSVVEVYAPGDESGWAVVYKPNEDGAHMGKAKLIWGKWELFYGKAKAPYTYDTDAEVEEVVRKNRENAERKSREGSGGIS